MSTRRIISVLASCLVLVSILLSSCATPTTQMATQAPEIQEPTQEVVTLEVTQWHTMEEQFKIPFQEMVIAFEDQNPNIKIEVTGIPWLETLDQLTIRTAGGNPPDIALLGPDWAATLASMGALEPLENLLPQETIQKMQWAKPALIDMVTTDEHLYALTWYAFTFPLIYNKVVLQEAGLDPNKLPATIDELNQDIVKVATSGKDVYGFGWDFTQGENGGRTFSRWLWAYGGEILDKEGNVAFDSPEGVAALEAMVDLFEQSDHSFTQGVGLYESREVFAKDKVAFTTEAGWMRSILRDLSGKGEAYDASWGIAPWPKSTVTGKADTQVATHTWGVFKQSEHKEEAVKFINFLVTNREMQEKWSNVFGSIPVFEEYLDFELFKDPYYTNFVGSLGDSRGLPSHPQLNLILINMSVALQEGLTGADPSEALQRAANNTRMVLGQPTK